jgi:hypothetical protein
LALTPQLRLVMLEPGEIEAAMPELVVGALACLFETLPRVLAQRFQHEEALVAERLQQALVEQRCHLVEVSRGDRFGRVERERATKD